MKYHMVFEHPLAVDRIVSDLASNGWCLHGSPQLVYTPDAGPVVLQWMYLVEEEEDGYGWW